jgi:hypothetical protein
MFVLQWWTSMRQEVFECPPIKFFSLPNNFFKFWDFKKNYKIFENSKNTLITNEPTNALQ